MVRIPDMSKKIKILFFHFDLGNGGAEKVLVNLVNNLPMQKYEVTLKPLFDYGPNKDFIEPHIHYSPVFKCAPFRGVSPLLEIFTPKFLHKLFIREHFDVEIGFREGLPNRIISGCCDKNTKKFGWIHLALNEKRKATQGFRSMRELRECHTRFNATAAVSDYASDIFKSYFKGLGHKVITVHNVVERDKIIRLSKEHINLVLDHKVINLCSVGRLTAQKSYDRLLRALFNLKQHGYKNFHLYLLGKGELRHDLECICHSLGLNNYVTFLGYDVNPYKYVAKMDLFVCSSLNEGYSTAVTESIIVGTPVLTTDCSGMAEILGEQASGMIVENTQEALTEGLLNVFSDPAVLSVMKRRAEKRSKYFSVERALAEFENFISQ